MKKHMKRFSKLKLSKLRSTLLIRRMLMPLELQLKPLEQKLLPPLPPKELPRRNPRLNLQLLLFKRTSKQLLTSSNRNKRKRRKEKKKNEKKLEQGKKKKELIESKLGMKNKSSKKKHLKRR